MLGILKGDAEKQKPKAKKLGLDNVLNRMIEVNIDVRTYRNHSSLTKSSTFGTASVDDAEGADIILSECDHANQKNRVEGSGARTQGRVMGEAFGECFVANYHDGESCSAWMGPLCAAFRWATCKLLIAHHLSLTPQAEFENTDKALLTAYEQLSGGRNQQSIVTFASLTVVCRIPQANHGLGVSLEPFHASRNSSYPAGTSPSAV